QALGFFKSVALKRRVGSAPDKVVIAIEVVEQETLDVGFGVGYSMTEGVVGDVSIAERNLFGNGQSVRLKLSGSMTRLQAEAGVYYAGTDDITAAGRATGGMITGWGGQDVRLLDLFYKGTETVRGFANAGIGPRDTLSANQDALGGKMFYSTTAELLFQIP